MNKKTFYGTQSDPYLTVYRLLKFYLFRKVSICLHYFHRGDEDECCHCHPFDFITIILRGRYREHLFDGSYIDRGPFSVGYRRATHRHRIELLKQPCWTLCIKISKKPERKWGFWPNGKYVYWEDFIRSKGLEPIKNIQESE